MSNLQDLLKLRQAAIAGAKDGGAISGAPLEADKVLEVPANIVTGIQSSVDASAATVPQDNPNDPFPEAEIDDEKAKNAIVVYRSRGLRQFVRKNGQAVKMDNGFFYITTQSDAEEIAIFEERGSIERVEVSKK